MAQDTGEGKHSLPQTQAVRDRNANIATAAGSWRGNIEGLRVLPTPHTLQNSKKSYFLTLFQSTDCQQLSTDCCTPRALSQQAACRVTEVRTFQLCQTLMPALNGVTEVRLEVLTNVGEVLLTNRTQ